MIRQIKSPTCPSSLYRRISRREYELLFAIYRQRIDNVCTVRYYASRRVFYCLKRCYDVLRCIGV